MPLIPNSKTANLIIGFTLSNVYLINIQDVDPSKRPGAGPDGYSSLKKHPFFRGIDWKNLRKMRPPKLAIDANVFVVTYVN